MEDGDGSQPQNVIPYTVVTFYDLPELPTGTTVFQHPPSGVWLVRRSDEEEGGNLRAYHPHTGFYPLPSNHAPGLGLPQQQSPDPLAPMRPSPTQRQIPSPQQLPTQGTPYDVYGDVRKALESTPKTSPIGSLKTALLVAVAAAAATYFGGHQLVYRLMRTSDPTQSAGTVDPNESGKQKGEEPMLIDSLGVESVGGEDVYGLLAGDNNVGGGIPGGGDENVGGGVGIDNDNEFIIVCDGSDAIAVVSKTVTDALDNNNLSKAQVQEFLREMCQRPWVAEPPVIMCDGYVFIPGQETRRLVEKFGEDWGRQAVTACRDGSLASLIEWAVGREYTDEDGAFCDHTFVAPGGSDPTRSAVQACMIGKTTEIETSDSKVKKN